LAASVETAGASKAAVIGTDTNTGEVVDVGGVVDVSVEFPVIDSAAS
jgi:hypothetical protein